jgi:hypothetical protein
VHECDILYHSFFVRLPLRDPTYLNFSLNIFAQNFFEGLHMIQPPSDSGRSAMLCSPMYCRMPATNRMSAYHPKAAVILVRRLSPLLANSGHSITNLQA